MINNVERRYRYHAARGMTRAATARACGVTTAAVSNWAARHPDVKFRYASAAMAKPKGGRSESYAFCAKAGMTKNETAAALSVTYTAVASWAKKNPDYTFKAERKGSAA